MYITVDSKVYNVSYDTYNDIINQLKDEGPFRKYVREHPIVFGIPNSQVQIVNFHGHNLVEVPLPIANKEWTLAAFDYIRELSKIDMNCCYPVHGPGRTPNNNALYFQFED